jgi:uncharacterized damage-inducible protein DinB
MTPTLTLDELLGWNLEERAKWHTWLLAQPGAMSVALQPGGRFPTVGSLIDHIFLVEVRHTRRLQKLDLPGGTGVAAGDIDGLFEYAQHGHAGLRAYLATATDLDLRTPRTITVQSGGSFSMTPRKLLFHMALHETRHWAQVASAVRYAGLHPPGDHDLFYSRSLE